MEKKLVGPIIFGAILVIIGIFVSIIPENFTVQIWPISDILVRNIFGKILAAVGIFLIVFGVNRK